MLENAFFSQIPVGLRRLGTAKLLLSSSVTTFSKAFVQLTCLITVEKEQK